VGSRFRTEWQSGTVATPFGPVQQAAGVGPVSL